MSGIECRDCELTLDQSSLRVRCIVCQQWVDHHGAELVKTNHGSGRGWRCARCGDASDGWLRELYAAESTAEHRPLSTARCVCGKLNHTRGEAVMKTSDEESGE